MNSQQSRLPITYPTRWAYRIIGENESDLREAAAAAVGPRPHEIALSRTSSGKRYVSLALEVEVEDEKARIGIFDQLRRNASIKFVL
ncbi:MAG: DUF493 domain-containing protein [Acidobacteriota bacterium]